MNQPFPPPPPPMRNRQTSTLALVLLVLGCVLLFGLLVVLVLFGVVLFTCSRH